MGINFKDVEILGDDVESFIDDGFILDDEMKGKYSMSVLHPSVPIAPEDWKFTQNSGIYDVTGLQLSFGDIMPKFVKEMYGAYYILYQAKCSPSEVPDWAFMPENHENETAEFFMKKNKYGRYHDNEALNPEYVKWNAMARILDGMIQTNKYLIRHKM